MWNPLKALKEKISGPAAPEASGAGAQENEGATAGIQDLEKQGMMGKFFRHWKSPKLLAQLKAVAQRMQADGINIRDRKAVEEWLKAHQKEIESGEIQPVSQAAKPQTFVKTGPEIGRNDPCTCGSGKKYKKCCGAKA